MYICVCTHTLTLTLTHIYMCVCMSVSVNNMPLKVHPENVKLIRNTADYILSLEIQVVSVLFYIKLLVLVLREKRNSDRLVSASGLKLDSVVFVKHSNGRMMKITS